ncbi:peptidoglycan-binding domain-containing protein [Nannocystis punicea]|uniref:Peptidoglycan-binding domain-containing protein n=1 Tax=Nannocystis punicea TaxID=2995304 RepID=A0ABY7HEL2_9BACT|nr:peptidoglycan-binding domain-containing protein [Nannocystis poenicansa]WAS97404.1 peptidoglycan-binding domain-containing protein [Nannocystis poenicansa]
MKDRVVAPGECLASIAHEHGFFYQTLWQHERNAPLRSKRTSPHILLAGDVVHVPDPRPKEVSVATDARHRFRRRGVPELLRLRLLDDGEPRAGLAYRLSVDGTELTGETDADGWIVHYLSPTAKEATLVLDPDGRPEQHRLLLRRLDPPDTPSGVRARLVNLDYLAEAAGDSASALREALLAFQAHHGLPPTGQADPETRDQLRALHGC